MLSTIKTILEPLPPHNVFSFRDTQTLHTTRYNVNKKEEAPSRRGRRLGAAHEGKGIPGALKSYNKTPHRLGEAFRYLAQFTDNPHTEQLQPDQQGTQPHQPRQTHSLGSVRNKLERHDRAEYGNNAGRDLGNGRSGRCLYNALRNQYWDNHAEKGGSGRYDPVDALSGGSA